MKFGAGKKPTLWNYIIVGKEKSLRKFLISLRYYSINNNKKKRAYFKGKTILFFFLRLTVLIYIRVLFPLLNFLSQLAANIFIS